MYLGSIVGIRAPIPPMKTPPKAALPRASLDLLGTFLCMRVMDLRGPASGMLLQYKSKNKSIRSSVRFRTLETFYPNILSVVVEPLLSALVEPLRACLTKHYRLMDFFFPHST
jgi:hypothetical protein